MSMAEVYGIHPSMKSPNPKVTANALFCLSFNQATNILDNVYGSAAGGIPTNFPPPSRSAANKRAKRKKKSTGPNCQKSSPGCAAGSHQLADVRI